MGLNIFEKIIKRHSNQKNINIGDIVEVNVDSVMIHDFFAPFCIDQFNKMGFKHVIKPDNVVFIYDHLVPIVFPKDVYHHQVTEEFIKLHKIKNVYRTEGVCHQIMHEKGHVKPGNIIFGTDSHTVTYGALGAIATGIGYTEMAVILGTGKLWMKVPPTIKIVVDGKLKPGVYAKDLILRILSDLRVDGSNYKVIEFSGSTISEMSISSRLTLCNMTVEVGAKAGIIEPDEKTIKYLEKYGIDKEFLLDLKSDKDAVYEKVIHYNAETIEPLVACPYNVDNVKTVDECKYIKIDQAFIGSCTNGRIEDLEIAAKILKNRKVNKDVRLIIVPASREIYKKALNLGYIKTFLEAGAIVNHPACGLCCGISGGLMENGEKIISTNNRNFYGRMGEDRVEIYLASPATTAASAISGYITDSRNFLC
ncbi:2,3-dimethylmalate dehydratase large subunit [Clostridium sp. N3C]|uniref:3-isopropylmalate dehydratase large subunit n=1 Tax=Clostridium sp. N3C TaxID=1776758 RepID=UPI00092E1D8E|nr:3-isopropylmalate dehydratase large subunit [Clostridium sp. N3C]NLZ35561.1 3-isopropylmalate dehydratase large subunit [Clostridiales bacterium]SCN25780.1 2,3-dimethylmalate dehydratase large subunit [Clostridium sp. N3C]